MSKSFFALKTFHGGINSKDNPRDMSEAQFQDIQGLSVKDVGEAKSPGGYNTSAIFSSDATSNAGIDETPGYGLFSFEADNNLAKGVANSKMIAYPFIEDTLIADEAVLKIRQISPSGADFAGSMPLDDSSNAITKPNLVYYYKNGGLRVADDNLHSNAVPHKFIFIKRQQMLLGEANNTAWMWVSTELNPPSTVTGTNNGANNSHPTSMTVPGNSDTDGSSLTTTGLKVGSDIIDIEHSVTSSVTTDLAAGTYEFAASWVYDDGQESLLTIMTGTQPAAINNTNGIYIRANFHSRADGAPNYDDYGAHITGSRIYARRKENIGDSWHLAIDIDFARGSRDSMLSSFGTGGVNTSATTDAGSLTCYDINAGTDIATYHFYTDGLRSTGGGDTGTDTYFLMTRLNPMTYESINGYRPDIDANSFGKGHGWKDSTVLGTRVFLANVSYIDEFGTSKVMGDRILYSMPNKFDTFPNTKFLDIGADDGESFTAIEGFGGMLFAFKDTNMYIINVQSGSPAGWGLAGKYDYMGVKSPSSVAKTELGIVWANEYGCYISSGQGVQKLTNSISDTTWATFIDNTDPSLVSYEPNEKNIIVQGDSNGSNDLYVFNLPTKSWIRQNNNLTSTYNVNTNTTIHNGKVTTAGYNASERKIYVFQWDTTTASQAFILHTKDFDFGSPNLKKKIYSVVITLNNNNADVTGVYLKIGKDGNAVDTAQWKQGGNGETISANADWTVKKYVLNTPLIVESVAFELTGTGNIKINDFSVEYRPLRKRAD